MIAKAHMKMPSRTCQNFTNTTAKDELNELSRPLSFERKVLRTEILFNNCGILEVYHLGRQTTEMEDR